MMCIYYIVYTKQIIERVTIKREINRKNRIKQGEIGKEGSCRINNQPPKKIPTKVTTEDKVTLFTITCSSTN